MIYDESICGLCYIEKCGVLCVGGVRNYNDEGGLCEVVGVLSSLLRNHKNLEGVRLLVSPSAIMS